jgi:hypothetical protein
MEEGNFHTNIKIVQGYKVGLEGVEKFWCKKKKDIH